MKKILETKIKDMKAITLIALVVTIIVLIIIAGVSISLILGNNGIINKSQEGRNNYVLAANEEEYQMGKVSDEVSGYINGNRDYISDLQAQIDKLKSEVVLASNLVYDIGIKSGSETKKETTINQSVELSDSIDKYRYLLIEYANHNTSDGASLVYGNKTTYLIRTDEIEYSTAWINSYILMISQNTGDINTNISFSDKDHIYIRNCANYSSVANKIRINVIGISEK